jgi:hypothetical protein
VAVAAATLGARVGSPSIEHEHATSLSRIPVRVYSRN